MADYPGEDIDLVVLSARSCVVVLSARSVTVEMEPVLILY